MLSAPFRRGYRIGTLSKTYTSYATNTDILNSSWINPRCTYYSLVGPGAPGGNGGMGYNKPPNWYGGGGGAGGGHGSMYLSYSRNPSGNTSYIQLVSSLNGVGAYGTFTVNIPEAGVILTISIVGGGTGYSNGETVSIVGAGGINATGTVVASGGIVSAVNIISGGSNYDLGVFPNGDSQSFERADTITSIPGRYGSSSLNRTHISKNSGEFKYASSGVIGGNGGNASEGSGGSAGIAASLPGDSQVAQHDADFTIGKKNTPVAGNNGVAGETMIQGTPGDGGKVDSVGESANGDGGDGGIGGSTGAGGSGIGGQDGWVNFIVKYWY